MLCCLLKNAAALKRDFLQSALDLKSVRGLSDLLSSQSQQICRRKNQRPPYNTKSRHELALNCANTEVSTAVLPFSVLRQPRSYIVSVAGPRHPEQAFQRPFQHCDDMVMRVPSMATASAHELFAHGAEKETLRRWIMQYVPRKYLDRIPPLVRNHGLTASATRQKSAICSSSAGRYGSDQHCSTSHCSTRMLPKLRGPARKVAWRLQSHPAMSPK